MNFYVLLSKMCILGVWVEHSVVVSSSFITWCQLILMFAPPLYIPVDPSIGESGLLKPSTISGLMLSCL